MKKKILALLVVGAMVLTGCGSAADNGAEDDAFEKDTVVEETDYNVSVMARGTDEVKLMITYVDEEGEESVEESDSYVWIGGANTTIKEMMDEWGVKSIEPVCEDFEFLGWRGYKVTTEEVNGLYEDTEELLFDGKVFSTEEMMEQPLPECNVTFYTEWDFTCGGCEEHKLCTVYYIDDDRYFVCDDCYLEFATGMGLIDEAELIGQE